MLQSRHDLAPSPVWVGTASGDGSELFSQWPVSGVPSMIRKKFQADGSTRVTFIVDDPRPVSLVGDFNGWDPFAHPMVRRSNGTRSVALTLAARSSIRFRYLADGGEFYDDPHADATEPNGLGSSNCVVRALHEGENR